MAASFVQRWVPRLLALLLWAAAAASAVAWGLRMQARPAVAVNELDAAAREAPADPQLLARALGSLPASGPSAAPAAPPLASRFSLVGVVAVRSGSGAALIAVDGKPPKPFRVGVAVEDGLVLQSVAPRRAVLAAAPDAPPLVTLEMAPPRRAGS